MPETSHSCPQNHRPASACDAANVDVHKIYDLYRDYIKHEDTLINYRSSWLGVIQSFLITGYVLTLQKKFELAVKLAEANPERFEYIKASMYHLELFLLLVSGCGIALGWVALRSIGAAIDALQNLETSYREHHEQLSAAQHLPSITGGGHNRAAIAGVALPSSFPAVMMAFWIGVAIITLATSYSKLDVARPIAGSEVKASAPAGTTSPAAPRP